MIVIGLCGSSGSGKSTVCGLLSKRGIPCLDTDMLYHDMISGDSECSRRLIETFGKKIRNESGGVDRKALASMVFGRGKKDKLAKLNEISHHYILIECDKWLHGHREQGTRIVCIDAPLLFESGCDRRCHFKVCVIAGEDLNAQRIEQRDNISEKQARARLANQLSDDDLRVMCDYTIENNGSLHKLESEVNKLIHDINFYGG